MLRNFSFIIDDVLAGCALPGMDGSLPADLHEALEFGITAVVTLRETPLQPAVVAEAGLRYLHIPLEDFTAPTIAQIEEFVRFVDEVRAEGGAVLAHCRAGIGRTGTMLAAYLISQGESAEKAIRKVRHRRTGSIETAEQEDVLFDYERHLRGK